MIVHLKFTTITGKGDRALVESFLDDHTRIETFMDSDGRFVAVLRTEHPDEATAQAHAAYQAARFRSGLIAATVSDRPPTESALVDAVMAAFP